MNKIPLIIFVISLAPIVHYKYTINHIWKHVCMCVVMDVKWMWSEQPWVFIRSLHPLHALPTITSTFCHCSTANCQHQHLIDTRAFRVVTRQMWMRLLKQHSRVNVDFDGGHVLVSLFVISCIDWWDRKSEVRAWYLLSTYHFWK